MKVVCKVNRPYFLTKGKSYEVIHIHGLNGLDNDITHITIENDICEENMYEVEIFESLSISRNNKLNQLGI